MRMLELGCQAASMQSHKTWYPVSLSLESRDSRLRLFVAYPHLADISATTPASVEVWAPRFGAAL